MRFSKNIIVGFLALVLFANITFAHSLDFHICQGELQSLAFFGNKASCSKMMDYGSRVSSEAEVPLSCCDAKKEQSGLVFKQKPCCDNVQVNQDNVLNKSDVDQSTLAPIDFFSDFEVFEIKLNRVNLAIEKVEIPPPPNIVCQHTQEKLQVFQI